MTSTFEVHFGNDTEVQPAELDFYDSIDTLEIEENADLPGAFELTMPIETDDTGGIEDLTLVGADRFRPFGRVAVVVQIEGAPDACIFDGYVLAHSIHLTSGITASTVKVWGLDVSCLMNLEDKTTEHKGTDTDIAKKIFGSREYKITFVEPREGDDPGPQQELIQRGTDAQFLRERARRTGRLFRVCCDQRPLDNKGYFAAPQLSGEASLAFILHPFEEANVDALDFTWDVARPSQVSANALIDSKKADDGGATSSGLSSLDQQSLADFAAAHPAKARLTAAVSNTGELKRRSEALLRDAGWFVRCEGEADLDGLEIVPRVGMIVGVDGAGQLHSGNYLVWSVRHTITAESHRVRFVLVRNAIGAAGNS